jgi:hypothetical protein
MLEPTTSFPVLARFCTFSPRWRTATFTADSDLPEPSPSTGSEGQPECLRETPKSKSQHRQHTPTDMPDSKDRKTPETRQIAI